MFEDFGRFTTVVLLVLIVILIMCGFIYYLYEIKEFFYEKKRKYVMRNIIKHLYNNNNYMLDKYIKMVCKDVSYLDVFKFIDLEQFKMAVLLFEYILKQKNLITEKVFEKIFRIIYERFDIKLKMNLDNYDLEIKRLLKRADVCIRMNSPRFSSVIEYPEYYGEPEDEVENNEEYILALKENIKRLSSIRTKGEK